MGGLKLPRDASMVTCGIKDYMVVGGLKLPRDASMITCKTSNAWALLDLGHVSAPWRDSPFY